MHPPRQKTKRPVVTTNSPAQQQFSCDHVLECVCAELADLAENDPSPLLHCSSLKHGKIYADGGVLESRPCHLGQLHGEQNQAQLQILAWAGLFPSSPGPVPLSHCSVTCPQGFCASLCCYANDSARMREEKREMLKVDCRQN